MNKVLAVFFVLPLLGIGVSNTFGQAASLRATRAERLDATEAVQQVLAVDEARRLAMLRSDVSTLDSLLAEDATIVWGDGTADDKASTLALLRSGRLRYAQAEFPMNVTEEPTSEVCETACLFCSNTVRYIIDFSRSVSSPLKKLAANVGGETEKAS
jgi:uncharacterized protein DUF4440